jgi:spore coat polysaccharide biosynthesis protein SpsF
MNTQEKLWQGEFGTAYHERNKPEDRMAFWTEVLGTKVLTDAWSVLEPGAGKGENLVAIRDARRVYLDISMYNSQLTGIEVNRVACEQMRDVGIIGHNKAFLDMPLDEKFPLVITRGFLIHIPIGALPATLAKIYNASLKYICFAEYYSPVRREVKYQGHTSALWIDDFAGALMKMYPDLKLLNYGFKYHKDQNGNDLTYFLMEK